MISLELRVLVVFVSIPSALPSFSSTLFSI